MATQTSSVLLASGSPRRRELLGKLGVNFSVRPTDIPEVSALTQPAEVAADLARQKARAAGPQPGLVVLAADTLVALDGQLLGKPKDEAENLSYLDLLSGRTHEVYTGVAVFAPDASEPEVGVERTLVTFRDLTPGERAHYAASGEGLDKAGGYGIQGLGMALIARVEGDYSNVVGLPLALTTRLLRGAGLSVWGEGAPTP